MAASSQRQQEQPEPANQRIRQSQLSMMPLSTTAPPAVAVSGSHANAASNAQTFGSTASNFNNAGIRKAPSMHTNALTNVSVDSQKLQNATPAHGQPQGLPGGPLSTSPLVAGFQSRYALNLSNVKPGSLLQNHGQPGGQSGTSSSTHGPGGAIMISG